MRYNIYRVRFNSEDYEVCEEDEQRARIACAHANFRSVSLITACEKIGETDKPYIKKLCKK